ncbi:hypothetical protein CHARACLAT_026550, partial [Characodon lateralis]|nr:hypothetical protein [Characodon lateralis]
PRFRNDGEVTSRSRWIRTKQNTHCRPHRTERVRPESVHGVRGEGRRTLQPQTKTKRRDTELSSVQNLDLNRTKISEGGLEDIERRGRTVQDFM